jgi:hypothetical protein
VNPPPLEQIGQAFQVRPPAALPPAASAAIGAVLLGGMRKRFNAGVDPLGRPWPRLRHPRPEGGDKPLLNFGILRNSYRVRTYPDGAEVYSSLPQARTHNFGATIVPRGKALAIPLTVQAKRAGSPRRMTLRFRPVGKKGGNVIGVLYEQRPRGGFVDRVDHFLLVRRVEIPARWHVGASADDLRTIEGIAAEYGFQLLPPGVPGVAAL